MTYDQGQWPQQQPAWQPPQQPAWQPPQQQPAYLPPPVYNQQPQKTPKKTRNIALAIAGVLVVIIVIAVAAGGGAKKKNTASSTATTAVAAAKASPSVSKGLGAKDATADITVGAPAAPDAIGAVHVPVAIVNHSSKRSDYFVTLALESADGKTQYDTTIASATDVEPGQAATADGIFISSGAAYPAGAIVSVKEVQRTASS